MSTEQGITEPEKLQRVELARDFAQHLVKGIKQIGMYRHNESRFPEFLARAHEALEAYAGKHGALSLKVEAQNFALFGQPLFQGETSVPYRFFRDGIRQLIFRSGIAPEELVTFTLIALSDPERGGEDAQAQLWRAALPHVEYVVVEGFKMEDVADEEVEVEVDKVVSFLYGRLKADSDDYLRFARVSTEDLDAKVDDVDQIRGAVVAGATASDALKARIQREIEEEEQQRLFPKLVSAVFQVVESGIEEAGFLEEIFVQLLDAMLMQEDLATINNIVLRLRAIEQAGGGPAVVALRQMFVARMGEEQRVGRLGEILRGGRPKTPQDLSRYLKSLGPTAAPALLNLLDTIETPEGRTLLYEVLAPFARETPEPFVDRMESDRSQTVRDMVQILELSGHPERVQMFSKVLAHPNVAVKLEALGVIARGQSAEARKLVVEALGDASTQVRMLAARLLPEFDREKALADLSKLVKDPSFEKRSPEERTAFYAALASTGLPAAFAILSQVLATKPTLLTKKKVLDDKLLAVAGLGTTVSVHALKLLQAVMEDKSQPSEVLLAARKAVFQTRKALFGEGQEAS